VRLRIHAAQFPDFPTIVEPLLEPLRLQRLADLEPVFDQDDSVFDEGQLHLRAELEKGVVLLIGAETQHMLDACPVIPTAVEQHDRRGSCGGRTR